MLRINDYVKRTVHFVAIRQKNSEFYKKKTSDFQKMTNSTNSSKDIYAKDPFM
jgi:hypothetical protein